MALQDVIVVVFIAFGFLVGCTQNVIKKLFRIIILIGLVVLTFYAITPTLSEYLRYDLLNDLGVTIPLAIDNVSYEVTSIEELFLVFENHNLSGDVLLDECSTLCQILSFLVLFVALIPISLIISGLLWHLLVKHLFPKKVRKGGIVRHLLGGVLGAVEWFAICIFFVAVASQITGLLETSLVPMLEDESSSLYQFLVSMEYDSATIQSITDGLQIAIDILSPYSSEAMIIPSIFELFAENGCDLLSLYTCLGYDESGAVSEMNFVDSMSDMIERVIDLFNGSSDSTETVVETVIETEPSELLLGLGA